MSNGSFHFYSPSVFTRTNVSLLCKIHFKTRPGNGYVMHVLEFMSVYLYFKFPHTDTHRIKQESFDENVHIHSTFFTQFLAALHHVTGCVKQNV